MLSRKGTRYKDAQRGHMRTGPKTAGRPRSRRFASTLTNLIAILALFVLVYALQHFAGWFTDHKVPTEVESDQTVTKVTQRATKTVTIGDAGGSQVKRLTPPVSPQVESESVTETISSTKVAATEQHPVEEIKKKKRPHRLSRRRLETRGATKHRVMVGDLDNEAARLRYRDNNRTLASGGTIPEDHHTWSSTKPRRTSRYDLDVRLMEEHLVAVENLDNEASRRRYQDHNRILASGGTIPEGYSPWSAASTTADDFIPFEQRAGR